MSVNLFVVSRLGTIISTVLETFSVPRPKQCALQGGLRDLTRPTTG